MSSDPNPPDASSDDEWATIPRSEQTHSERLDRLLTKHFPQIGRSLAARLCAAGEVLVDGRRAKKGDLVPAEATVQIRLSAWGEARPEPALALEILLERDDLVVVNKPPGMPTGALIGKENGTLAGALLARYPEMADVGFSRREPGVVHRLDNYTSGVVLAARRQDSFIALRQALERGLVKKRYLALIRAGTLPDEGVIELRLENDPQQRSRVRLSQSESDSGYPARTSFEILKRQARIDLVEASAGAAFRHQVRAHLAAQGAPLLGDSLYGGPQSPLSPRHALHAHYIACAAPGIDSFEVECCLPSDLSELLSADE